MASGAFELVIFDCDGVLVDSEVIACRALSEALLEFGLKLPVDEIADRFLGTSTRDMYAALETDWGCKLPDTLKARVARPCAPRHEGTDPAPACLGSPCVR